MPGYVIHLATVDANEKCQNYRRGVIAPDILKKWYKISCNDIEDVHKKYEQWKTPEMPDFNVFAERIQQKERMGSTDGLHYGESSSPDIGFFMEQPYVNMSQAFWMGYHDHLVTDKKVYQKLGIDRKFNKLWQEICTLPNAKELYQVEVRRLHDDWNILNKRYSEKYAIVLPPEVEKLNVVKYKDGETVYINVQELDDVIEELRAEGSLKSS